MEWSCELLKGKITVSYGPYLKGYYKLMPQPYCEVCSLPSVTVSNCTWHHSDWMNKTIAMGPFDEGNVDDLLRNHILGLKGYRNYAEPLAYGMTLCLDKIYRKINVDMLVPVPRHKSELRKDRNTGQKYNQALELAKLICERSEQNIKINDCLVKKEPHSQRDSKNWFERMQIMSLFECVNPKAVKGKKILIIDDVRTSGFTASGCAKALKYCGAEEVILYVAGRTVLRSLKKYAT